jgi:creatinine amidohydrolase
MRSQLYSVRGPKSIPEMTLEEVAEALDDGVKTVVIGTGSCEPHGPHLPLGCDTFQVTEFVKRTVVKLGESGLKALAGPTIPFGMSVYYQDVPGTCTISSGTLKALIKEICHSLYRNGFRRFALVLGHGGNYVTMMDAAQELIIETEGEYLVLNWVPELEHKITAVKETQGSDGHAGEINSSIMMATQGELVEMRRAPQAFQPPARSEMAYSSQVVAEGMPLGEDDVPFSLGPLSGGGVFLPLRDYIAETMGTGIVGDPHLATPAKGEAAIEIITNWLAAVIVANWGKQ